MTAVTAEQQEVRASAGSGDSLRAMFALARVEATRLLRHPVTIAGILLFFGPEIYGWLSGGANRFPILHIEDSLPQFGAMLMLGGAALIAANLAALRAHRHATTALYDTLVLPTPWRTGGFLLSVVPFGVLVAVLVVVRIGLLATLPGAAGRPNPYELATFPAIVLLLAATGVLLARLVRAVIVAPLLLLGLAVATVAVWVLPSTSGAKGLRWFLPAGMEGPPMPLPADLMGRQAGWHLAYVAGLIVLVAAATLAVTGARGRRLVAFGVTGLSVTILAGSVQLLPMSKTVRAGRATAVERPAEVQTCRRIDQVTYCAFDDFTPWISGWDAVMRGVLRRVPAEPARQPLTVRQRVSIVHLDVNGVVVSAEKQAADAAAWQRVDAEAGTPNAVTVGTEWGDGPAEAGFAALVAYEVIVRAGAPAGGDLCGSRGVLVVWLAGQATPKANAGLRELDANSSGAVSFGDRRFPGGLSVPDREVAVALALLKRPADEITNVVRRSWAELTAKGTSVERAGELFGIPVTPLPPGEERYGCEA